MLSPVICIERRCSNQKGGKKKGNENEKKIAPGLPLPSLLRVLPSMSLRELMGLFS